MADSLPASGPLKFSEMGDIVRGQNPGTEQPLSDIFADANAQQIWPPGDKIAPHNSSELYRYPLVSDTFDWDSTLWSCEILPDLQPPIADAGSNDAIVIPTTSVTLDGTGSHDPDGTISTYAWSQTSGPITTNITSPSSESTTATGITSVGTYTYRLDVTDNDGLSDADTKQVSVTSLIYTLDNFPGDYGTPSTWSTMRFFYIGFPTSSLSTGFEAFQISPALQSNHRLRLRFDYWVNTPNSSTFSDLLIALAINGNEGDPGSDYVDWQGTIPGNLETGSLEVLLAPNDELQYEIVVSGIDEQSGNEAVYVTLTWNRSGSSLEDDQGNTITNTVNGALDTVCTNSVIGNCQF